MAMHMCVNATQLDTHNYSSPVPIIGLYVAVATMVCLLLLLCDILAGLRRGYKHFPCRFFSLNSLTLTLLTTATKLPVDLTTPMPSTIDQLSKLTGTGMTCVYMGFVMPSVGISRKSDSLNNMVALSILVVTITVDTCIQIGTGVIFSSFVIEHVIILFFMLVVLVKLWICTLKSSYFKELTGQENKDLFRTGGGDHSPSMLDRLKLCYIHSSLCNPQLSLCGELTSGFFGMICMAPLIVLLELETRSVLSLKELMSCQGSSDYGWSMWTIVVSQNLIILVGSFCISFRWFTLQGTYNMFETPKYGTISAPEYAKLHFIYLEKKFKKFPFKLLAIWLMRKIYKLIHFLAVIFMCPVLTIISIPRYLWLAYRSNHEVQSQWWNEFQKWNVHPVLFSEQIKERSVREMEEWLAMKLSAEYQGYLFRLFDTHSPSDHLQDFLQIQRRDLQHMQHLEPVRYDVKLTCLSVVILVRITEFIIPNHDDHGNISNFTGGELVRVKMLKSILDDLFEILFFIDTRTNAAGDFRSKSKCEIAQLLWSKNFERMVVRNIKRDCPTHIRTDSIEYVIWILKQLLLIFPRGVARDEIRYMKRIILNWHYTTTEQLYNGLEQLFFDMIHTFLVQLPNVIFQEIMECPVEEMDERIKVPLKFFYRVQPLENKVQWRFPQGTNITRLTMVTTAHDHLNVGNPLGDHDQIIHVSDDGNAQNTSPDTCGPQALIGSSSATVDAQITIDNDDDSDVGEEIGYRLMMEQFYREQM